MSNASQIRTVIEDNGFLTIDDNDFESLFLAEYSDDMESDGKSYIIDFSEICDFFEIDYQRVDSNFVAIFRRD